ncbi:Uu.00g121440.m01.CDS01 [Anthostomella pinea]|uniref:Uu.00g121440.m01.CDS01 n=1 Tax=Anthostomella pinea TaxID=933095 RepID=A0AAI8VHZ4_9PEZI|nr:Uu.00g121440.m01.CDS01 [Anthostomella pinea]
MRSSNVSRHRSAEEDEAVTLGSAKQKTAKRGHAEETSGRDATLKRRRRAFSCLSCQKLKCRIECSLRGEATAPSSNLNVEQPATSVEDRLQRHEDTLQEIKSMVKELKAQKQASSEGLLPRVALGARHDEPSAPTVNEDNAGPDHFSSLVDKGTDSAPVAVLRGICEQVHRGYRRLLEHVNLDLVQLQLVDEQTATELIELFLQHQGHTLLACSSDDLKQRSGTRPVSAFLHSVCSLIGIVYRDDICGTALHRQVYEQVRITLGQALLSSPLNLEEINAVLLMSNNANTPSSQGLEYIDSWLLTGYCAQQAMLSTSFSKIVNNVKRGNSTTEDHRAIHQWATICLHHLQWAATTGRPSILSTSYIDQCNILLSFYQATMQDGMLVAEIMLYSTLHQKLSRQSYLGDGGECEEFLAWKQKWNHLLALSTSSMLRIGYHAACLILAVRSLEETGRALNPNTFLSTGAAEDGNEDDGQHLAEPRDATGGDGDLLRANACRYALLVLQTFLEMPPFLMDAIPTCLCLCIGYCALVLAHYTEAQSKISDQLSLSLITHIDQWIRTSPGKSWSYKYGALAKNKVEARCNRGLRHSGAAGQKGPGDHRPASVLPNKEEPPVPAGRPGAYNTDAMLTSGSSVQASGSESALPAFDLNEQSVFPNMEDFFGGGFLDFMK